jgi:hypothetical protein
VDFVSHVAYLGQQKRKGTDDASSPGRRKPEQEPCQAPGRNGGGRHRKRAHRRRSDIHAARTGARHGCPCLIRLVEIGQPGAGWRQLRYGQFRLGQFEQRTEDIIASVSQQRIGSGDVGRILTRLARSPGACQAQKFS